MNNKPKMYVTGAVLSSDENSFKKYEMIKNYFSDRYDIYTPLETSKFKGTDEERYLRAEHSVKNADIVVHDFSQISSGQGVEFGICVMCNKPMISVAKAGSKVSAIVKGALTAKGFNPVIMYSDEEELLKVLEDSLSKLNKNICEK